MKFKKSYIRLFFFELLLIILLLTNAFVFNFLSGYNILLFLLISLFVFSKVLNVEKYNRRHTKDIIFEIIIFMLIFFIIYYLSGVLINNFYRNEYFMTFDSIKLFVLPLSIQIILTEVLRYSTIIKSENSKVLLIFNVLLFILLDFSIQIGYADFSSLYNTFLFISMFLIPSISKNIVASYFSLKFGYKPFIVYLLLIELYKYILPIIPNYNKYLYSIMMIILPILLLIRIIKILEKNDDKEICRDYKKTKIKAYMIPSVIVIVVVYLTSGYFKYSVYAIASASMSGTVEKGDMVVISKVDNNYETLKEGDIIAFKHNDVIIVHRIIKVVSTDDKYYFYTKGDANESDDGYPIDENDIVGRVTVRLPYIGIPTVWINGL